MYLTQIIKSEELMEHSCTFNDRTGKSSNNYSWEDLPIMVYHYLFVLFKCLFTYTRFKITNLKFRKMHIVDRFRYCKTDAI